jgi:hypothetical protein
MENKLTDNVNKTQTNEKQKREDTANFTPPEEDPIWKDIRIQLLYGGQGIEFMKLVGKK